MIFAIYVQLSCVLIVCATASDMNRSSYKVALGGVISAMCLLGMFLTGVIPFLNITLPMIAGVLITVIAIEVNSPWAVMTYIAVSFLSIFVTFDKTSALLFILFFGHYPIIKPKLEKIALRPAVLAVKLLIFNVCIVAYYELTIYLLGIKDYMNDFPLFGKYAIYAAWGFSNVLFLMYDYSLSGVMELYIRWLKPKIFGSKKNNDHS